MPHVQTQISFKGFTEEEVRKGLPHLELAFQNRPWLLQKKAWWDRSRECLVIAIEVDGDNPAVFYQPSPNDWDIEVHAIVGANWDEINELVDASFHQSADEVTITVDKSILLNSAKKPKGKKRGKGSDSR